MKDQGKEYPELDMEKAAETLDSVFVRCGRIPNSVPVTILLAYSTARTDRYHWHRRAIAVGGAVLAATLYLLAVLRIPSDGLRLQLIVLPAIAVIAAIIAFAVSRYLKKKRSAYIYRLRDTGYKREAEWLARIRDDAARRRTWLRSRRDAAKWWEERRNHQK